MKFFEKFLKKLDWVIDWGGIPGFIILFLLGIKFTNKNLQFSAIIFGISLLLNFFLKHVFKKERRQKTRWSLDYACPSSHAQQSFLFTTFFLTQNIFLFIIGLLTATYISYSRTRLKVHDTKDVIGGAIIGIFLGVLFTFL